MNKDLTVLSGYSSTFPSTTEVVDYLRRGRIISEDESPADMVSRVTRALCSVDTVFGATARDFRAREARLGELMDAGAVVMSTPILTNAGRKHERPLTASIAPDVSSGGHRANELIGLLHEVGMGTGFNLDDENDPVAALKRLNDLAVDGARSGREDRPVGNMALLSIEHPKAVQFARCKMGADERHESWKFNISMAVSEHFVAAALQGDGRERQVLREVAEAASACGDPGLVFLDRLERWNPTPKFGSYRTVAPCAEVAFAAGEAAAFAYINVAKFVQGSFVDVDALRVAVWEVVRALDNALELSMHRLPSRVSTRVVAAKRKIGVGVCGVADALIEAGLPYDSRDGRSFVRDVVSVLSFESKLASVALAEERGPFPAINSLDCRYRNASFLLKRFGVSTRFVSAQEWRQLAEDIAGRRLLRNSATVALPPTGRSAPIVGASQGIEPLFDLRVGNGVHPGLMKCLRSGGDEASTLDYVREYGRLPADLRDDRIRALLKTATEIAPLDHLQFAVSAQTFVDDAVSKTVNVPASTTPDEVLDVFLAAAGSELRGITVFRDQSRAWQPKQL